MDAIAEADLSNLLPPLLRALDALIFIQRHLHPPELDALMEAVGTPETPLQEARAALRSWPAPSASIRAAVDTAGDAVLAAFDGIRTAPYQANGMLALFRALRQVPQAQEALYPLAAHLPAVSRFFLEPERRDDADLLARLAEAALRPPRDPETGVSHGPGLDDGPDGGAVPGARGGYAMYVPETYDPARAWPLVMALHGGSGNGRAFLWSWLREARTHGAIVVAPTAIGQTWALMGDDPDTPNLARILGRVRERWNIDGARLLLTGMSDGGTFTYVTGLEPASPFTHLAPAAAAFHPMLAQMADRDRLEGLPIHLAHGARDWMFPVDVARQAQRALTAAGARVTFREIADLSHCYPREINGDLLAWMAST